MIFAALWLRVEFSFYLQPVSVLSFLHVLFVSVNLFLLASFDIFLWKNMHKNYLLSLEEINPHPHCYFLFIYLYIHTHIRPTNMYYHWFCLIVDFRMIHITSMNRVLVLC